MILVGAGIKKLSNNVEKLEEKHDDRITTLKEEVAVLKADNAYTMKDNKIHAV